MAGAVFLTASCGTESSLVEPPPLDFVQSPPRILVSEVVSNEDNVLSAIVVARVEHTDSVVVRFGLDSTAQGDVTPAVSPVGDSVAVPVLGLLPDSVYYFRLVAYRRPFFASDSVLSLRTGSLPADLPSYVASGPDPSPGFVVFAAGHYGLAIDNGGRVAWYHRFEYGAGLSFSAQRTGTYVARPVTEVPTDPHPWVEIDPLGRVVRTLTCAFGLEPRLHEVILEPDGSYWLMCDETRTMDLSDLGGVADARVTATDVQHMAADGTLLFSWSPFNHFDIADLDSAGRAGETVNWTHGNALDLDADGNVIVSFRNLSEITKIDVQTGDVLWRLGGARSQFTFLDTQMPAFVRQHGARVGSTGLLLLDNLGDSLDSRVEEYALDPVSGTARLLAGHGSTPQVVAQIGGSVQELPGGRILVSFGSAGRVEEYDADGNVVWRIEGTPGYVFRAQRIRSLYRPGVGLPR